MTDDLMKSSGSGDAGNSTHADEQRLYPKVRFRGFDEPWKKVKLGEISEKITQKNNNSCSQFPVLTNSAEYGIVYQKDFFDKNIAINTDNYYVVHTEDFVYNPRISKQAPYGPIRVNHLKTGVMSPLYYIFKIKDDFNIGFFEFLFIGNKWHKFMYQNGDSGARSDRYAIKDKVFNKLPIYIPQKIEEQKLIFEINHKINSLLYLQQRKLELEKQIFYALKTHIFAKDLFFNGQKDMIKYKLKDVSNMYQPETITATQMSTNGYKVFGANGYIGHYYNFNHKDDAITICARGASTGAVNFVPGPVWITGNSMVVDIDSKLINQLYFYYYLTTLNLKKYITGGAQPQLTKEILNGINVNLIPINIQIKVANILVLKLSNFLCK
ncbi:restriction endonuclease subunit S [Lactobacillus jensenii]|uniref:restriction endonuclease subunit S n=1 Tax=Lactobacillus jensenii TaxID=109790 RepID=UPI001F09DD16|nr:restriction endonuclease subunit S [Lactobacillus jensenii]MCZ4009231.1 restriction endonuclease subunit S [Lactobacillus jensenii]MCZ4012640.1 restriction endonuclease subunit S [Lactobacillus jensenii]